MERSLRRQTRELEALLEAGRAMAASIDYDEVLRRVARAAGEALGTAECVIWEYSPDTGLAEFRCLWERDPVPGVAESLVGDELSGQDPRRRHGRPPRRRGRPAVALGPRPPPDDAADMDRWGEKTWLTVPLVMDGQVLGVMILIETRQERRFDADEVRMAGVIGEQAAMAMRNALRHRREEERNRWLRSLVAAGRAVSAAHDPDDALEEVARLAAEAMQSPAAFIYEYAPDRDVLVTRARWTSSAVRRDDAIGQAFPVTETPQDRRALEAGEVFVESISDPALPRGGAGADGGLRRADPAQRAVAVARRGARHAGPRGGRPASACSRPRSWTSCARSASRSTLALSTARSATTDGLTGLANHRVFYERLEQELARGRRYDAPVSLLMIDIDDFKELNDTYGHPAGDEALRRLGLLLAEQLRRGIDLPARYGGEEFAVILPNTGRRERGAPDGADAAPPRDGGAPAPGHREGAEALAERLRRLVAASRLPLVDGAEPVSVRVSIGVASYPDMAGDMDDLVARADAALYAAKRAGKDRVEVYWRRRQEPPRQPPARLTCHSSSAASASTADRPRIRPPECKAAGRPGRGGRPLTRSSVRRRSYFARSSSAWASWASLYSDSISRKPPGNS